MGCARRFFMHSRMSIDHSEISLTEINPMRGIVFLHDGPRNPWEKTPAIKCVEKQSSGKNALDGLSSRMLLVSFRNGIIRCTSSSSYCLPGMGYSHPKGWCIVQIPLACSCLRRRRGCDSIISRNWTTVRARYIGTVRTTGEPCGIIECFGSDFASDRFALLQLYPTQLISEMSVPAVTP